jgi:hypothetical protein
MNAGFFSIFVSHFDLIITGGQTKGTEISISLKCIKTILYMGKGKQSLKVFWFKILKSTVHRTVLSFFLIRTGADAQLEELGPMTPVSIILLSCFSSAS